MNPKSFLCSFLAISGSALLLATQAHSTSLYWDTDGTGIAGSGAATGTWGTSVFWSTDSTGANVGSPVLTATTISADDLFFSAGTNGTVGTVTVSGTQSANKITFDDAVTITLSGGTAINLGGGTGSGLFFTGNAANTISTGIILDSAATAIAISNSGTSLQTIGAITGSASTGTQTLTVGSSSSGGITLNGIIGNGVAGGNVALTVNSSGAGLVTLSGANTFTGAITMNAGTLVLGSQAAYGSASGITFTGDSTVSNNSAGSLTFGAVSIADGKTATFDKGGAGAGATFTFSGALTGGSTSTLSFNSLGSGNGTFNINNGAGFTGTLQTGSYITNGATTFNVASLGDGGKFRYTGTAVAATFNWTGAGKTFDTRVFEMASGTTFGLSVNNNSSSSVSALVINTALSVTTSGAKTFTLGGTNAGLNTFGGNIADGSGTVAVTKSGTGTWVLSGANGYTGATTVSGGTLIVSGTSSTNTGAYAVSGATLRGTTANAFANTTSIDIGASGILQLRGDANTVFGKTTGGAAYTTNITATGATINVGQNTLAGTNQTFTLGAMTISSVAGTVDTTISGANNTSLILGAVTDTAAVSGTVQFINNITGGGSLTLASYAGTRTTTPTLTFSGAGNTIVTGAISQTGTQALTYSGTGTLTLNGASSYTGATTVNSGRLLLGSAGSLNASSAVSVVGGALGGTGTVNGTVALTTAGGIDLRNGSVGTLTLGNTLAIQGGAGTNNLSFDLGNAANTSDTIIAGGATTVTTTGAAVITLNQLGGLAGRKTAGTTTLIQGTTSMAAVGQFALATTKAFGQTFALSVSGNNLQLTTTQVTASAGNVTLSGTNPSWIVAGNFSPGNLPDYQSNVTINSAIGTTGALNASQDINSLIYGTGATTATTVTGGTAAAGTPFNMLVLEAAGGNGITVNTTANIAHTISANVGLASSQTWTINNPNTASDKGLTVSGVISDFGGGYTLTKTGIGNLTLSGTNTYSGGTILDGGFLTVSADANLGAAGSNITVNSNSVFRSTANVTYARDINIVGASTLLSVEFGNSQFTISGNVSGAGGIGLTASNAGGNIVTLSGTNNTFLGALRIGNNNNGGNAVSFTVASLADSATANGNIVFFTGNTNRGITATDASRFQYSGTTNLTLANRQIEFISATATPISGHSIVTSGTGGSLTINTDLLVNTNVAQMLSLVGGTIAISNTFAGKIADATSPLSGTALVSINTANAAPAAGSNVITLGTLQGIVVGAAISGTNIAPGTTVTAIDTLNRNVTISNNILTGGLALNQVLTIAGVYNGTSVRNTSGSWILSGANTHTGFTRITGGSLTLANSLAIQYSALDTTNSVAGSSTEGLRTNQTVLTIGGLVGNKNFASTGGVFNTAAGAGYDAVTALTLNVGSGLTTSGAGVTTSYTGVIANGAAGMTLTKTGAGTQILTGTNTYTGATNINQGILSIGTTATPTGSINSSAVTINGGNFRYNSSTNYANTLTFTSGTISGTNWNGSLGAQTIGTGQTISPGNSPGTATTTSQTWAAGGTYVWEINNVTATAGLDPGWDLINGTSTLNITASTGTEFIIDITSLTLGNIAGNAVNFNNLSNYSWLIADFASITGFDTTDFIVDATGFNGNTFTGAFAVALGNSPGIIGGDSTQIWVTYTAIPEPKAALLGCIGLLLILRRRR